MEAHRREQPGAEQALDLDAFVAELGPRLVAGLTAHTGDRLLAEELAQETLIRCIERWDRVAAAERPDAWAFRTAFNLSNSRWRRLRLERRVAARQAADDLADTDVAGRRPGCHAEAEDVLLLRRALTELPERCRAVIVCRHLLGYDVRGTADVLGCAEGTVKAQTSKGLARLRELLADPAHPGSPRSPSPQSPAPPAGADPAVEAET